MTARRRWRRGGPLAVAAGLAALVLTLGVLVPLLQHRANQPDPPDQTSQPDQPDGTSQPDSGGGPPPAGPPPTAAGGDRTTNPSGIALPSGDLPGWRQIFVDDFDGTELSDDWFAYSGQPDGDPGGWFDPGHVSVGAGMLTIGGWREASRDNIYVTGGVSNRRAVTRSYGRYDIRFRMDQGTGIAYALLLWPGDNVYPPEIDIAEDNGKGRDRMYGVLHPVTGDRIGHDVGGDFTRWHTAGLEWTPDRLVYTLDGEPWATITGDQVPDEPMALALQSQAWYCGHTWEACPDETTPDVVNLQIDWVAIYAPD
ncbi:glycosyl hydrolase family 16 [Micromonospora sp. Llam0]|uniref:glycoside hydrolase family 16 protein n=1 Tax=Micromonospora sp. Llam0 TaxID=2485143 RepID=UPI000F47A52F|nr:glycoside hydrolase family 16 protein [Micromonospora sp. Llam0]ROO58440.1 glycosyl hydrolase family 16 [Micromonospora sp. Llam0]